MINAYLELVALLVLAHLLADYPLQGDFLAKAKNHTAPIPGVPAGLALLSHAGIHAGFVWLITGSALMGAIELVLHAAIDHLKCAGKITFTQDQWLHFACKCGYASTLTFGASA
jgi:hypothetical protein